MPHIHCYLDRAGVVWLHCITDFLIGTAYFIISLTLYSLIRRIKLPFSIMFVSFGIFIGACGMTHFMEIYTLWYPAYWLSGVIKAITAFASVTTGIYLFKLRPDVIMLAEVAKEAELGRNELFNRTQQLTEANNVLQAEIAERKHAEQALSASEESLRVRENTLRSIFDSTSMIMGTIDIENEDIRFVSGNKASTEYFGRNVSLVEGKLGSELGIPRETIQHWINYYRKSESIQKPVRFEYWDPIQSENRCLSTTLSYIDKTPDGHSRFSYIIQDITQIREAEITLQQANEVLELRVNDRTDDLAKLNERLHQEIDQQKKTEDALKKSQGELVTLANHISQLIWMADEKGWIYWYNQRWYDYTGTDFDQMQGWGWKSVQHPDHAERVATNWNQHLKTGTDFEDTFPMKGKDGKYRWFLTRALPIRSEAGDVVKWFGTNTDITEQREAEQKMSRILASEADSRQTLELALKGGEIGIFDWNVIENVHVWSEHTKRFFGMDPFISQPKPEELLQQSHPDDRKWLPANFETLFENQERFYELQYRVNRKDGSTVWLDVRGQIFYGPDSKPVRVLAILIDVTKAKNAERSVRESEERLRQLTESMPQIVWRTDSKGVITFFNEQWFRYTGSDERAENWGWGEVIHPDDREKSAAAWQESLTTGKQYQIEYRLKAATGDYRWFLGRGVPMLDADKKVSQWFGTCTDIHDQKETIALRDEFISIASHELKTPITSLILQNQIATRSILRNENSVVDPKTLKNLVDTSTRQLGRLARLVDDMLDVSRIQTGKFSMEMGEVDFGDLVKELVDQQTQSLDGTSHPIKLEIADGPFIGNFDRIRIEQMVSSLLSNAIKYGEGKLIHVRIHRENETFAVLSVQDFGLGIPKQDHKRIFGKFERAIQVSNISGLGLGLSIASEILKAHHGSIEVTSELGKGSIFKAKLPVEKPKKTNNFKNN